MIADGTGTGTSALPADAVAMQLPHPNKEDTAYLRTLVQDPGDSKGLAFVGACNLAFLFMQHRIEVA